MTFDTIPLHCGYKSSIKGRSFLIFGQNLTFVNTFIRMLLIINELAISAGECMLKVNRGMGGSCPVEQNVSRVEQNVSRSPSCMQKVNAGGRAESVCKKHAGARVCEK